MQLHEVINKVNTCTEEFEFSSARKYIESNLSELEEHKHKLNKNAREIFNFISDMLQAGYQPLTRQEIAKVKTINTYASTFNIKGLKMATNDSPKLFIRNDIGNYLNKDAKVILDGWGVLNKD
ncbi:hypothetical protein [Lentibacillus sp. Marseille-P4043]|uniref:hypothetical protein n=1 Tax=Lentibacillus sp. Marseille-P4043 TaxID=2040293 RepID=UPI000D0B2693|nr:hypothetical protein [Lentibacillus sp. Marseille-P4043]